jgi:hypothetical protein
MTFEVLAADDGSVAVETADCLMALLRGVDERAQEVSGVSCSTTPAWTVRAQGHGNLGRWLLRPLAGGPPVHAGRPTPIEPPTANYSSVGEAHTHAAALTQ